MHGASGAATELARNLKRWAGHWRVRLAAGFVVFLLLAGLIVYRFSPKTDSADCAFRISKNTQLPAVKGDAFRVDTCVKLEKAVTNSERTLGLSGRESLPADRGMLFDFQTPGEYCMWMKDMRFGLDMMWLNEQKEIIYIIEGVTPETYPKSFCGPAEGLYVVEVNAGIVKAADLRVGQRLRF